MRDRGCVREIANMVRWYRSLPWDWSPSGTYLYDLRDFFAVEYELGDRVAARSLCGDVPQWPTYWFRPAQERLAI